MARRIIFALLCTLVLLGAARRLSSDKPRDVLVEDDNVKLIHRTVTEHMKRGQACVRAWLEAPQYSRIMVHFKTSGTQQTQKRGLFYIGNNQYEFCFPPGQLGSRLRYAIVVTRPDGSFVRIPKGAGYYVLKYKQKASEPIVAAHVAFMFGAFFFMVLSVLGALRILRRGEGKRSTVNAARWALILAFIGTWPLGLVLNWQTFGVLWQGYPFGRDITDNKTQIIFLAWLVSLLLVWGSFMGRGEERDRLGAKAFAWAIVASFVVSLALYILPHSL